MAAPWSTRFIAETGLAGTASYVVPAGFVAVVRDWTVFHGVELVAVEAFLVAPGPVKVAVYQDAGVSAASDAFESRIVVYELETIQVVVDAGNVDTTVSGYLLSSS